MENLVCILWLIFFPFFTGLSEVITYRYGKRKEYSDSTTGLAALIYVCVWAFVGVMLYET